MMGCESKAVELRFDGSMYGYPLSGGRMIRQSASEMRRSSGVAPGVSLRDGPGPRETRARVFVVDDEDFIRELYRDVFEAAGMTVFAAVNGEDAVKVFKSMPSKPDIIIMDHRMPGKDGIEATKEILQIDPTVPIIFSSADESVREKALDAGACSFWAKPFPCSLLVNAMIDIVKTRRR